MKSDPLVKTPKQILERTLEELEEANYNMPTHFFTHLEYWVDPAMELQLDTQYISPLVGIKSDLIKKSVEDKTEYWEDKVPYSILEDIKTYIATKRRNF